MAAAEQPIGLLFVPALRDLPGRHLRLPTRLSQSCISFNDYFFAAPGAKVDRPWVGFENYCDVLRTRRSSESFFNVFVFMVINVPLTVVLALVLAYALNSEDPRSVVLPRRLLRALRHGQRGGRRGVAVLFGATASSTTCSGRWRPTRHG